MTDLASYFESVRGTGVLATSDHEGRVNVAVYARPHVMADGTTAFVMHERLTRQNPDRPVPVLGQWTNWSYRRSPTY